MAENGNVPVKINWIGAVVAGVLFFGVGLAILVNGGDDLIAGGALGTGFVFIATAARVLQLREKDTPNA